MNTTLPVIFATKMCPKPKTLAASIKPVTNVKVAKDATVCVEASFIGRPRSLLEGR